jgi:hypothetical protein
MTDGQAYLTFIVPSAPPVPPDGIRWLDQEKIYRLPVSNGRVSINLNSFLPRVSSRFALGAGSIRGQVRLRPKC